MIKVKYSPGQNCDTLAKIVDDDLFDTCLSEHDGCEPYWIPQAEAWIYPGQTLVIADDGTFAIDRTYTP